MLKLPRDPILSPLGIFIIYVLIFFPLLFLFRLFFPYPLAPLALFSFRWRLIQGVLDYVVFFPALAMAALVAPFGLKYIPPENISRFSSQIMAHVKGPIITAIVATLIYGILSFLVMPLAQESIASMEFQARLYRESREKAVELAAAAQWSEAEWAITVCDHIWPGNPELEYLRTWIAVEMETYRMTYRGTSSLDLMDPLSPGYNSRMGQGQGNPLNLEEAMKLAEQAMEEDRYYDAHWLATLASRLAAPGRVEGQRALRLASQAWNALTSVEPNAREEQSYALYHLKRSGYEAMVSGDWIRSYYIFKEYVSLVPRDPDGITFFQTSEEELRDIAFFIDDADSAVGDVMTDLVFSIPHPRGRSALQNRLVVRINSLSALSDLAYGMGVEILALDGHGQVAYRVDAPYIKIVPETIEGRPQVVFLMRALDRDNRNLRWDPVWTGSYQSEVGNTQMILDIGYSDFLLLASLKRGMDRVSITQLISAETRLGDYGIIPQVYQAEILGRLAEPVIFMPLLVLVIILGWRYRSTRRIRYMGLPMLIILPVVFNGFMLFYRNMIHNLGIWLVFSLGYLPAIAVCLAGSLVLFFLSLIGLTAQRG